MIPSGKWWALSAPLRTAMVVVCFCVLSTDGVRAQESSDAETVRLKQGVSVSFMRAGIAEFKGTLRSEAEAMALFSTVRSVRPDLEIVYDHLVIDENAAAIPVFGEIPSFIQELALTTHEGFISSKPGEFLVSGLTDSLITRSVFQVRLSLIGDRSLRTRNLICLVATEDLPDAGSDLPDALTEVTDYFPKEQLPAKSEIYIPQFGPFGILASAIDSLNLAGLEKLMSSSKDAGLLLPDRLDWLFLDEDRNKYESTLLVAKVISVAQPIAAMPIEMTEMVAATEEGGESIAPPRNSLAGRFLMRAKPAGKPELKVLAPVSFSEKNFTVSIDQMLALEKHAKELLSGERAKDHVILSARVGGNGAAAFNEWISQRRVTEVRRMLVSLGVPEDRLSIEMKASRGNDTNPHRVDILVPDRNRAEEATASIFRKKPAATPIQETVSAVTETAMEPVTEPDEQPPADGSTSIFRKKPAQPLKPIQPLENSAAARLGIPMANPIFLDVD